MHVLINAFIIFHLFLMTVWLFPLEGNLVSLVHVFRGYIMFIGMDQSYSMFAPTPPKKNRRIFAVITFNDGSSAIWRYPSTDDFKYWQSMGKERYRKFVNDNLTGSCFRMFWPDFCRYIARLYNCPQNPPQTVSFYVNQEEIIASQLANSESFGIKRERSLANGEGLRTSAGRSLTRLFTYIVEPTDLETK